MAEQTSATDFQNAVWLALVNHAISVTEVNPPSFHYEDLCMLVSGKTNAPQSVISALNEIKKRIEFFNRKNSQRVPTIHSIVVSKKNGKPGYSLTRYDDPKSVLSWIRKKDINYFAWLTSELGFRQVQRYRGRSFSIEAAQETVQSFNDYRFFNSVRTYAILLVMEQNFSNNSETGEGLSEGFSLIADVLRLRGFKRELDGFYVGNGDVTAVSCVLATQELRRSLPWFQGAIREIKMLRIEENNDLQPAIDAAV
jgi:virulence-associated protein VapD